MRFSLEPHEVDERRALIYMWEIRNIKGDVVGLYIGKAKRGAKRPLKHYSRNVERFLKKRPYRQSKPDAFRKIHLALANAVQNEYKIVLRFLCNVSEEENIDDIERHWIEKHGCQGHESWQLNG